MKPLTATFAAAFLMLISLFSAGTAQADEWKMGALSSQVSILPEALGLQNTDRREFLCLSLAIYHEARGESHNGKLAVAHVVYNRTQVRAFPETICGVIWQKGQFGWTPRPVGSLLPRDPAAWLEAQKVAFSVYTHRDRDPTGGATYFYSAREHKPKWAYKANSAWRTGGHIFCNVPNVKRVAETVVATVEQSIPSIDAVLELASVGGIPAVK